MVSGIEGYGSYNPSYYGTVTLRPNFGDVPAEDSGGSGQLEPNFMDRPPYTPPSWSVPLEEDFGITVIQKCSGSWVVYDGPFVCNADASTCGSCGATPTNRYMEDFGDACCTSNIGRDFYTTIVEAMVDCPPYIKFNLKESLGQVCVGQYWHKVTLEV
jgi:hypothetical protein